MHNPVLVGVVAVFAACTSVEWTEAAPEVPTAWRNCRLFASDAAFIASHAYYVLGKSRAESLGVAEHSGAGALRPVLAEAFGGAR